MMERWLQRHYRGPDRVAMAMREGKPRFLDPEAWERVFGVDPLLSADELVALDRERLIDEARD